MIFRHSSDRALVGWNPRIISAALEAIVFVQKQSIDLSVEQFQFLGVLLLSGSFAEFRPTLFRLVAHGNGLHDRSVRSDASFF